MGLLIAHLVVSWIRWQGRKPDRPSRPKQVVRVCWEHLVENPVKMISDFHHQRSFIHIPEVAGSIKSGPCSALPLSTRLLKAVVVRSLVLAVAVNPRPAVEHKRLKGQSS